MKYEIPVIAENKSLVPQIQHETDAGADLRILENVVVTPNPERFRTGIRMAIPRGHFGMVVLRSSMYDKGIAIPTSIGVIDSGYRGEIMIPLKSTDGENHRISAGTRIAQLIIIPCISPLYYEDTELPDSDRGTDGFGSTGSK